MKKKIQLLLMGLFLALTILSVSCKKESNTKIIPGGVVYQYGTNIPVEGVTVYLSMDDAACSGDIFNCLVQHEYKSVITDVHGTFNVDNVTSSIYFHKNGYIGLHGNRQDGNLSISDDIVLPGPFGASSIYYLDKIGWAKLHVTNPDGKRIGNLINFFISYLGSGVYYGDNVQRVFSSALEDTIGKSTNITETSIEIADAENYIQLIYFDHDRNVVGETLDSFYVKSGDTALVDIKVH